VSTVSIVSEHRDSASCRLTHARDCNDTDTTSSPITVAEPPSGEVTHTVVEPDTVAVEEPVEAGDDPQVAVHLTGGGQHLVVRLEREPLHA
jgi:hypothetical protein